MHNERNRGTAVSLKCHLVARGTGHFSAFGSEESTINSCLHYPEPADCSCPTKWAGSSADTISLSSSESVICRSCRSWVYALITCQQSSEFPPMNKSPLLKAMGFQHKCPSIKNPHATAVDCVQSLTPLNPGKSLLCNCNLHQCKEGLLIQLTLPSPPGKA